MSSWFDPPKPVSCISRSGKDRLDLESELDAAFSSLIDPECSPAVLPDDLVVADNTAMMEVKSGSAPNPDVVAVKTAIPAEKPLSRATAELRDEVSKVSTDTTVSLKISYRFPHEDADTCRAKEYFQERLSANLAGVLDKLMGVDNAGMPYRKLRPVFIAVNLILNERGVFPPRFRSTRKMPRRSVAMKWSEDESLLSNDRQVLDLHWLACTGRDVIPSKKWESLFSSGQLNFEAAERFVATVGAVDNKLEELRLIDEEMWGLAVLQTKAMRQRWSELEKRFKTSGVAAIRQWLAEQKNRTSAALEQLELQFLVLGLTGKRYTAAAELVSMASREHIPVSPKLMQRRHKLFAELHLLKLEG